MMDEQQATAPSATPTHPTLLEQMQAQYPGLQVAADSDSLTGQMVRLGRPRLFTPEEEVVLLKAFRDGMSFRAIARQLGVSDGAIARAVDRAIDAERQAIA